MKAITFTRYGGPEILQPADLPTPTPGPGQLLVRVAASSVNPVDWKIASGKLWPILRARFPAIPGFDIAGTVESAAPNVTSFPPGTRVHSRLSSSAASAQFALASSDTTVIMPPNMDFATAAGLPLAGMTALQALRDKARMPLQNSRQRILIIGASGGVGHLAVQIARAAGATVIAICSTANRPLVESLGAHQTLDYKAPNPYRDLAPCDIILDCIGQPASHWLPHLTPRGTFVTTLPGPAILLRSLNPFTTKKSRAIILKPSAPDLQFLDQLFTTGQLKVITHHFPLEQLPQAWHLSISHRTTGKIIIDIPHD